MAIENIVYSDFWSVFALSIASSYPMWDCLGDIFMTRWCTSLRIILSIILWRSGEKKLQFQHLTLCLLVSSADYLCKQFACQDSSGSKLFETMTVFQWYSWKEILKKKSTDYKKKNTKNFPACDFCLFDLTLYVPVNSFSVMLGRYFLGWTGTKQG